jgi:quinol monooxygenase YgiN
LQQNTELLVVTLAHILPGTEGDTLAGIHAIGATLRSASGLIASHIYRGEGNENTFLMLTTWADTESWHQAQTRHNPRQLLSQSKALRLMAPPEQYLMSYLWGHSRPTQPPVLASAHLITLPTAQMELTQKNWLQGLQHTHLQFLLTFAFVACGQRETPAILSRSSDGAPEMLNTNTSILFGLFNWASVAERDAFYRESHYQTIQTMFDGVGHTHILPLRPC